MTLKHTSSAAPVRALDRQSQVEDPMLSVVWICISCCPRVCGDWSSSVGPLSSPILSRYVYQAVFDLCTCLDR